MRILLVNWQDPENPHAGGAELHAFELFSRLVTRGHPVHLVCSGWRGAARTALLGGISVERHGGRHGFALAARAAVRNALAAQPWDIVVEDINKLPLFLPWLTPLPFCAIVPHLFGTTAFQEASWPVAALVNLAERPIPRVYRRAGFHAISESTRDDLIDRGVLPKQIRVIHPGIDASRYAPAPGLDRTSAPTFLYVGRLRRYKGIEVAIRALALVRAERADVSLDIAGAGADEPRLRRLAAGLGLGSAVRFHGYVNEGSKLELFRKTWANVFPSPKEGWGLTVMEAAGCGTPSLASDSPGLRDSVQQGRTGYLVPHGDAPALAARMLELAAAPELVDRMGREARRAALAWSWDDAAAATERHLAELIAGRDKEEG
ncbi:MAG TPA: glycosyltransferase family 4 protein [Gemmatimonadales bacterium]|nr:glycosyltransferase family 4 protein [Gemmatimonadales bacterium]